MPAKAAALSSTDFEWDIRSKNSLAQERQFRDAKIEVTVITSDGSLIFSPFEDYENFIFVSSAEIGSSCLVEFDAAFNRVVSTLHGLKGQVQSTIENPLPAAASEILKIALSKAKGRSGCFVRTVSCAGQPAIVLAYDAPWVPWQEAVLISGSRSIGVSKLKFATNDDQAKSQALGFCQLLTENYSEIKRIGVYRSVAVKVNQDNLLLWSDKPRRCVVVVEVCDVGKIKNRLHSAKLERAALTKPGDEVLVGEDRDAMAMLDLAGYSVCKLASSSCSN
ncbi:hypothetical protein [Bradyrhizobium canariense]|uniref:hypothetical protein n=1 Tax=Bradyrhizobium canariense TaxID=255045 RepID=UPI0011787D02|nr:hypothetical protein [Bradyrhizobium canariense]